MPSGLLWADRNIGAERETDYGLYFSWGNTDGYTGTSGHNFGNLDDYDAQSQTWGGIYGATAGGQLTENFAPGSPFDAATAMLGAPCKMPTRENIEELLDTNNCTNVHVDDYKGSGVAGRLFTSVANGKTLFFPYAGYVLVSELKSVGENGDYLTTSLQNAQYADVLGLRNSVAQIYNFFRNCGYSVRAVK